MAILQKLDARRRRLGMSRAALARRAGVSLPTVHRVLTGKEDAPSVTTLNAIAAALGMEVQIVEVADVDELREEQAKRKARRLTEQIQGTMGLESQGVGSKQLDRMTKQTVHELLAGSGRRLWDD
jgi:transcriptional regulator with XRE-family HTH domain